MSNPERPIIAKFIEEEKPGDDDPDGGTVEEIKKRIGEHKRQQMIRAIRHVRYGIATPVELHYLKEHHFPISIAARRRTIQKAEEF